jgi:transglutaminase-like putative cysteine protease
LILLRWENELLNRKWIIITLILSVLIGGLKASPVLATKGDWSLSIFEKLGLYRSNEHYSMTIVVNSVLSLAETSEYILPSALVENHQPEIKELAYQLTKGLKTEHDKSMAIFKWVATNITYDAEAFFQVPQNPRYYSALETLKTKVALCSGYANLNAALHRAIGMEARVVYGEGHAWNEVKISGEWQEQDPTYASGGLDLQNELFIKKYSDHYFTNVDLRREGVFPW